MSPANKSHARFVGSAFSKNILMNGTSGDFRNVKSSIMNVQSRHFKMRSVQLIGD